MASKRGELQGSKPNMYESTAIGYLYGGGGGWILARPPPAALPAASPLGRHPRGAGGRRPESEESPGGE
jgi:hypothetical protein